MDPHGCGDLLAGVRDAGGGRVGSPRVQTDGANVRRQGAIRLVQRHATSSHYDDDTL